ncbi:hypothetical protein bcgnr5378_36510 [Bacillus cereus]|uniref:Uncharacterized protein n=1 Tax=Bacillus cereus TaxID=1396 RepID=A0A161TA76_BACCE|nr:hypothetical protein [Bacillus cereus]KZD72014.1 hypothetical protein B4088_0475 [Bacillus cereus]
MQQPVIIQSVVTFEDAIPKGSPLEEFLKHNQDRHLCLVRKNSASEKLQEYNVDVFLEHNTDQKPFVLYFDKDGQCTMKEKSIEEINAILNELVNSKTVQYNAKNMFTHATRPNIGLIMQQPIMVQTAVKFEDTIPKDSILEEILKHMQEKEVVSRIFKTPTLDNQQEYNVEILSFSNMIKERLYLSFNSDGNSTMREKIAENIIAALEELCDTQNIYDRAQKMFRYEKPPYKK